MISVVVNIVLKFAFVWGLGIGAVGLALGTSLAIWVNVAVLIAMARRRNLIAVDGVFWRAAVPSIIAAAAVGAASLGGVALAERLPHSAWDDVVALAFAVLLGGLAYVAVVFLFRRRLPLGRFARP
jgi:putative peptidoglycan lipid II flippase